ncbi:MAG: hypothetical protein ACOH5I_26175 [Oligoflexus sp.]
MSNERKRMLARFRAKKSYLMRKKGLSESEAIAAAKPILDDIAESAGRKAQPVKAPAPRREAALRLVKEPSQEEVRREVEKLKAQGTFTEIPTITYSAERRETPALKVADSAEHKAQSKTQSAVIGSAAFCALIVGIASWLLVDSSLEVFGSEPEGWGKSIILELGILGLAVSKSQFGSSLKEIAGFFLSKATLIFLVILSFAVLHTGVESQRSEGLTTAESTSTILTDLTAERDLWQKTYDSYAENRVSDRRDAMKEISRLNEEIRKERAAVSQSLDSSVINLKSNTEMMIRAALLLLNIIFGHKLAQAMATIKWPPLLREERLVS